MKSLEFHLVISLGKTSSLSEKPSEGTRGGRPLCHGVGDLPQEHTDLHQGSQR